MNITQGYRVQPNTTNSEHRAHFLLFCLDLLHVNMKNILEVLFLADVLSKLNKNSLLKPFKAFCVHTFQQLICVLSYKGRSTMKIDCFC